MSEALLGAEGSFSGEPVFHVMTIGCTVVLVVEVGADGHRLGGGREGMRGGRRMRCVAVAGLGGILGGSGRCVWFHGKAMLLSLPRVDRGVNAHS
jgi:hypothetical protein